MVYTLFVYTFAYMKNDKTLLIRLPKALLDNAKKVADKEGISLSAVIRIFLSEYSTGIINNKQ